MRYLSHRYTQTEFDRLKGWYVAMLQETKPDEVKALEKKFLETAKGDVNKLTKKDKDDYTKAITNHIMQCNVEFEDDFGVELRGTWTFDLSDGWYGNIALKMGENDFFHDHEPHMHIKHVAIYSLFVQRWDLLGAAG